MFFSLLWVRSLLMCKANWFFFVCFLCLLKTLCHWMGSLVTFQMKKSDIESPALTVYHLLDLLLVNPRRCVILCCCDVIALVGQHHLNLWLFDLFSGCSPTTHFHTVSCKWNSFKSHIQTNKPIHHCAVAYFVKDTMLLTTIPAN